MKRKLVFAGIALLVIAVVGLNIYRSNKGSELQVKAAAVESKDLEVKIFTTGKVAAAKEEKIYAKVSGVIKELKVEEGTVVKTGDVLAVFDTQEIERQLRESEANLNLQKANLAKARTGSRPAELEQAKAKLEQSKKEVARAKEKLERTEKLYSEGAVTKEQLELAREELSQKDTAYLVNAKALEMLQNGEAPEVIAAMAAQVAQAETAVNSLREQQQNSLVRAAMDGVVLSLEAEVGKFVSQGTPVMSIGDVSSLKVKADVNEGDSAEVKIGQKVQVNGSAFPGLTLEGTISKIAAAAVVKMKDQGQQQTVIPVEVNLPADKQVKPGVSADLNIITKNNPKALVVPYEAVQENDKEKWVYTVENGIATKQLVQTGMSNEIYLEITSGLKSGQKVVLNPPKELKDKGRVKVLD